MEQDESGIAPYDEVDAEADEVDDHDGAAALTAAGGPSRSTSSSAAAAAKRKIRRFRPFRSCLTCNKRKIRCDRESPCGPCLKRGEGEKCTLGTPLQNPATQTTSAILDRLAHLEARVEDLEHSQTANTGDSSHSHSHANVPYSVSGADDDPDDNGPFHAPSNSAQTPLTDSKLPPTIKDGRMTPSSTPVSPNNAKLNGRFPSESQYRSALQPIDVAAAAAGQGKRKAIYGAVGQQQQQVLQQQPQDATEEAALVLESLCNTRKKAGNASTPSQINGQNGDRSRSSTILIEVRPSETLASQYLMQRSHDIRSRILHSPAFPSRQLCDYLTSAYFKFLDVYWHVHVNFLFEAEYSQFWVLHSQNRLLEVDPAWVALFLMTLSLGLQVAEIPLPAQLTGGRRQSPDESLAVAECWVDDAQELLKAADWSRRPQIRVLQTIILFNGYQSMTNFKDPSGASWNAAAIRIAQLMGLHELSLDSTKMPDDDPAMPLGDNAVKIQLGRRMWISLVILEHVYAIRLCPNLPLASTPFVTAPPANIDDIDLLREPIQEKPNWKLTNTSSVLLRWILAVTHRELLILPAELSADEKYSHVLNIDAELRKWLFEAPANPLPSDASDYESYKSALWRQWAFLADVHGQLLYIHRPYMVRGYSDSRYALSTKVCLESAKIICESRHHLQDSIVDERFWWTSMRWLSAAIVIFIDLYQAIDAGCSDQILSLKKADIPGIQVILKERTQSYYPPVRDFAAGALHVIQNLLDAETRKRESAHSRRNSVHDGSNSEIEPVGQVLQRIAKTIAATDVALPPIRTLTDPSNKSVQDRRGSDVPSLGHPGMLPSSRTAGHSSSYSMDTIPAMGVSPHTSLASQAVMRSGKFPDLNSGMGAGVLGTSGNRVAYHHGQLPQISGGSSQAALGGAAGAVAESPSVFQAAPPLSPFYHDPQGMNGTAPNTAVTPSQLQAPITWDTSHFFHPDPSLLLQSMGYNNAVVPKDIQSPHGPSSGMFAMQYDPSWGPQTMSAQPR